MPTGLQLVNKVREYQESGDRGYVFGARGQTFTRAYYDQLVANETDSERLANLAIRRLWILYD